MLAALRAIGVLAPLAGGASRVGVHVCLWRVLLKPIPRECLSAVNACGKSGCCQLPTSCKEGTYHACRHLCRSSVHTCASCHQACLPLSGRLEVLLAPSSLPRRVPWQAGLGFESPPRAARASCGEAWRRGAFSGFGRARPSNGHDCMTLFFKGGCAHYLRTLAGQRGSRASQAERVACARLARLARRSCSHAAVAVLSH